MSLREIVHIPDGDVCADRIRIELEGDVIRSVEFEGGCPGNAIAIGRLAEGMTVAETVRRLRGIDCEGKGTSCADQMARALAGDAPVQNDAGAKVNGRD